MKVSISILILSILLHVTCRAQENSEYNLQIEKNKIGIIASKFSDAIEQGNADSLAILFDENASYATNNGYLLQGREQIREAFAKWLETPQNLTADSSYVVDLTVKKDLAYMLSYYSHHIDPPNAESSVNKGYGLTVFARKNNGSWKIKAMTVNKNPNTQAP